MLSPYVLRLVVLTCLSCASIYADDTERHHKVCTIDPPTPPHAV